MLPFQLHHAGDVMIVAAGMGGDVGQALQYGVKSIDAVNIDPVIIELGKQLNALQPYADPRTHLICDDAWHFMSRCNRKCDLVLFSQLDSHTVLGTSSSVRLDNYIHTEQSFRKALQLVKPGGLFVVSFRSSKPWFADRLYRTIKRAAG